MFEPVWTFDTENFRVSLELAPCDDLDLSWDDDGTVAEKINDGTYTAFDSRVVVYMRGNEIASDYLGQSIYNNVPDFWTEHRSEDPMNRNCTLYRAKHGENHVICHYFPEMVRIAVKEARQYLASAPSIRKTA